MLLFCSFIIVIKIRGELHAITAVQDGLSFTPVLLSSRNDTTPP